MRLTVPLNQESLAFWSDLAPGAGSRPGTVQLPGDPRRYIVVAADPHRDVNPELAHLDVRLVLYVPLAQGARVA